MQGQDWKPFTLALIGSWPSQVNSGGRETIAAYVAELEARGVSPDAALVAIRSSDGEFPPSAGKLAAAARTDPSAPTFDELLGGLYAPGGVVRALWSWTSASNGSGTWIRGRGSTSSRARIAGSSRRRGASLSRPRTSVTFTLSSWAAGAAAASKRSIRRGRSLSGLCGKRRSRSAAGREPSHTQRVRGSEPRPA